MDTVATDRTQRANQPASNHSLGEPRLPTATTPSDQSQDPHQGDQHEDDVRTLRAMQALMDTALSHLSLDALLPELLERVRAVMRVDNAAILLVDEESQELVVRAARGPEEELIGQVRVPFGDGFAGRIAATQAPLAVADTSAYPVSNPMLREKLHSLLGVPLMVEDRVLGVIHIGAATPHDFTPSDEALLVQVADRIARAVERSRLFAEVEQARILAEQRAAFLSTTMEALGDGLVITDAEGRLLYGNPAFSALLGATATRDGGAEGRDDDATDATQAPFGSSRLRLLGVQDASGKPLALDELVIARALRGETLVGSAALDVQIQRLDGQDAYLNITGAPVRGATGELLGAVMAVRDVTERRRLEERALAATRQARERSDRLEVIFAAVADGLFVYDTSGHIVERNPAADAMLAALEPPESRDASVFERGHRIGGLHDAEGRALTEAQWPQARIAHGEVLSGPTSVDIRLPRVDGADGRDMYLSVSGAPLRDENGAAIGSVCLYRDVTERWELSEALQQRTAEAEEASARLNTLLEVLPVGVAIVDAAGKPVLVNEALRHIWGENLLISESTAQYGAYTAWRTDTGKQVASYEWGLVRALHEGVVAVGQEYDIESFDGQRKAILDSSAPLRDASGAITGAVSVIFDITARRQAEQRTREALEAFIALTGALVEVPGEDAADVASARETAAGDDVPEPVSRRETSTLARRLAELTRSILGCRIVAVSSVEQVEDVLYDRPVAMVGMPPELERKWWDEQLALPPHEVGVGMLPDDRERLIAGEVFTFDLTRPPYEAPNDYGVTALLAAAMRTQGRMVGLLALDFQDPDGRPHIFTPEEIQIAEAVARLGAVALERDRLLREREAARAEALALAEANRRMDEFLSIAGHELRTPITTIKANLQLAERRARQAYEALQATAQAIMSETSTRRESGPSGDSQRKARGEWKQLQQLQQLQRLLERAAQSAERQERLVRDLLDISRISSGQLEHRMAPLDLAALVRETVQEQRLSAATRRIELAALDEPLLVLADADRLGQVLTNYLTNALKYSEPGRPVAVTVRRLEAHVRIEVRDQGPGLTPEQRERLFERFYRVPDIEVMSGSGVGLGLGLYISKTIVEQHGGVVGVESAPGRGSVFWFTLPLLSDTESTGG
jgi:PAS domain S-box-containing protein